MESQDLQADALRGMKDDLGALTEIGRDRAGQPVDLDEVRRVNNSRRLMLRNGGFGLGALAGRGLLATGFGAAIASLVSSPVAADEAVDIQILQTAGSLETLAIDTYKAALGLDFISGNPVLKTFAETTMMQHDEHRKAFNDQAEALGGKRQETPNAKYLKVVEDATPGLTDAGKVVSLAMALEQVATQTYVANMSLLENKEAKTRMASVMGVEAQHLATLRAVGALIEGGAPELIKIPIGADVAKLPAAAGSVAFPEPFEGTEMASPPEEGAVK
ncbi:MAG: ferritin-like domain-containing protein [Acidimicrobiales bacterium]